VLGAIGGAVAVVPYLYRRLDAEIRNRVQARLAEHYVGLEVKLAGAEFVEGEGIKARNLVILEPGAEGPHPELLHVEEVILGFSGDLKELLQGEPQFTHITIRRPTLRVTRRPDGTWSAAKLLPLPKFNDRPIETRIENAIIEIRDPLKEPASTLTLRDINLVLSPLPAAEEPGPTPGTRKLQGTLAGDHVRHVEFQGLVDLQRQVWSISGAVEGLDISPELHSALPEPLAAKLAIVRGLRGQGELKFEVACDPTAESPYRYQLTGRVVHGRIDDPRLPHPLTDLYATAQLSNEGLVIEELAATSNQATIRMSYRQAGFGPASPKAIEAEIRQLELDRRLLAALPESLQEQWHKYRPMGLVDADVKLSYDGQDWHPDLAVRCLNVSFTHYKFPYRLEEGKGALTLKEDLLQLNLTAYSGSQAVRLDGRWTHVSNTPLGWLEATGQGMHLDAKLLAALPEDSRPVVQSLHPQGTVDFYYRLWRDAPEQPPHRHLVVALGGCAIQYDKFPYPVRNIRGTLEMFDGSWTFRRLKGFSDAGCITGDGHLVPTLHGNELYLRLVGIDVPLDKNLRDALRPNEQQVWQVLKPRGVMDLVADIRYLSENRQLSVGVQAETDSESTSIEPVHFPYRLEKLHSVLRYRDGHVTIDHFKAEHGPVKVSTGGYCDFSPDGKWHLRLEGLSVDRLRLDRDLIQALPERLKKALVDLRPTGPVNIQGSFDLEPGTFPGDPVRSRWDVQLGLHEGSIDCGVKLENIHGRMSLAGASDGQHFQSRGELAIDSLHCKEFQFTQVMGPIWLDDRQVLLGAGVARREQEGRAGAASRTPEKPRHVTARLFGGILEGDGWVALGAEPRYALHANLSQADLARCAREVMTGQQRLRGTIMASVDLRGSGRSTNALGGHGTVRLRNADVYELPLMIALLKILSIRVPDQNAFSQSDMEFRIEGEHIYFDRIDFTLTGDAISLKGQGEMDFQQAIKLTFHGVVGRGDVNVPVLKEVFTGASRQIMLIHVDGTLQNPETRKEAFPGVNQALQQLQGERPGGPVVPGLFRQ